MLKLLLQMFAEGEDQTDPNADPAKTNNESSSAGDDSNDNNDQQQGGDKTPEQIESERVAAEQAAEEKRIAEEKARNAEEARKRREREKQEAIEKAEIDAIRGLYDTNPYTNEPIESKEDVEEFKLMRMIEKDGGDPVQDYSKYLKKYNKEKAAQIEEQRKDEEHRQNDVTDFQNAHPDVNLPELLKNEDFALFSEGKLGSVPLKKIYEDFTKFTSKYNSKTEEEKQAAIKKAQEEAAAKLARQNSSPGPLGGGALPEGILSEDVIDKMSLKEVMENLDKVNKSYEYHKKNKK